MPPQDQNDNQDQNLHPLQAQKLESMYTASQPIAPAAPVLPNAVQTPVLTQPPGQKKKIMLIVSIVTAVVGVAVLGVLFALSSSSKDKTVDGASQAHEIVQELSVVVSDTQVSFTDVQHSRGLKETQLKLAEHKTALAQTEQDINKLQKQFKSLDFDDKSNEQEKSQKAFTLAQEIIDEYEVLLTFQQQALESYGQLPEEISAYLDKYRDGGLRADFVSQTSALAQSAAAAKARMTALEVPQDWETIHELRVGNLALNEQTFTTVSQHYVSGADAAIEPALQAYSQENERFSEQLQSALKIYVKDSILAKKFAEYLKTYPADLT